MTMGNTGKDNRRVGKPENYCGSYPFKKKKKKKSQLQTGRRVKQGS